MSEIKGNGNVTSDMMATADSSNVKLSYVCSVDYINLTTFLTFEGAWSVTEDAVPPFNITKTTTPNGTQFGFCFQNITSYSGECVVSSTDYGSQKLTISFPWPPSGT